MRGISLLVYLAAAVFLSISCGASHSRARYFYNLFLLELFLLLRISCICDANPDRPLRCCVHNPANNNISTLDLPARHMFKSVPPGWWVIGLRMRLSNARWEAPPPQPGRPPPSPAVVTVRSRAKYSQVTRDGTPVSKQL